MGLSFGGTSEIHGLNVEIYTEHINFLTGSGKFGFHTKFSVRSVRGVTARGPMSKPLAELPRSNDVPRNVFILSLPRSHQVGLGVRSSICPSVNSYVFPRKSTGPI